MLGHKCKGLALSVVLLRWPGQGNDASLCTGQAKGIFPASSSTSQVKTVIPLYIWQAKMVTSFRMMQFKMITYFSTRCGQMVTYLYMRQVMMATLLWTDWLVTIWCFWLVK